MNKAQPQRRSKDARATDTRERLLAGAREVVARDGLAGATSRQITEAAGTNLASVTYHFGSKEQLVAAALAEEIESLIEPALAALEGDDPPATRLVHAVGLLLGSFEAQQHRVPLFFEAAAGELRSGAGPTGAILAAARGRLTAVIESLREDGTIPAWIEAAPMAALIVATAQGLVLQSALDPAGPSPREMAGQFARLLLDARP